jgi:transcriptional regulator with XRE-family HTH domain
MLRAWMTFSPAQCRAARNLLNWTQEHLASHSKLTEKTIADFERGATKPHPRTLTRIAQAFEAAGIEFLNGDAPGVRLRDPRPQT